MTDDEKIAELRIRRGSFDPLQPQQHDMVAETVLHAEPGQPSNPAVARLVAAARKVVGGHFAMQSLLDAKRELADAIDALDEAIPPTGPANEGHGR